MGPSLTEALLSPAAKVLLVAALPFATAALLSWIYLADLPREPEERARRLLPFRRAAFLVEHDWVRSRCPLALIFRNRPSACGPIGYGDKNFDWAKAIQPVHDFWRKRGRVPLAPDARALIYWQT